ncbi:MAG TPA: hypothetical protein DIT04_00575 [Dysgonomonas sp.]|nr:hypothetical protein [Dysgonomonas sp.]
MKQFYILLFVVLGGMFFFTSCTDNDGNHVNSSVKLLPAKIQVEYELSNKYIYTYKYDSTNRLVEYVETSLFSNNIGMEDMETRCKIVYNQDNTIDSLIISPRFLEEHPDIDGYVYAMASDTVLFEYSEQEIIVKYRNKQEEKIRINPKQEVVAYEYYGGIDGKLKITNTYQYDENGNIVRIVINNGIDSPYIPYTYNYDNCNGIFRHVNVPQWFMVIMLDQRFNMVNNFKEYSDIDGYKWTMDYSYNKHDYPEFMNQRGDNDSELKIVEAITTFDYLPAY